MTTAAAQTIHVPAGAPATPPPAPAPGPLSVVQRAVEAQAIVRPGFDSLQGFEALQRMATMFAASDIIPESFRRKVGDCAIVCEMAARGGLSPLFVFQNLYVVKGKPRWSGKACIAVANRSGLFTQLEFRWVGERGKDTWGCYATARRLAGGPELKGTTVDLAMVKASGWWSKKDRQTGEETSKWQQMPEQMFMYRAASMWLDVHYPEGLSGLPVENGEEGEVIDVTPKAEPPMTATEVVAGLAAKLDKVPDDTLEPGKDPVSMQKAAPAESPAAKATEAAPPAPAPAAAPAKPRGAAAVKAAMAARKAEPATAAPATATPPIPESLQKVHAAAAAPEEKAPAERKDWTHGDLVAWFRERPDALAAHAVRELGIGHARAATALSEARGT